MKRIPESTWAEIRTAYASGISLREIARNMNIPEGTVLARAKREGWSRQRDNAKALVKREEAAKVVTPFEAASATMQQRGEPCATRGKLPAPVFCPRSFTRGNGDARRLR